MSRRYLSVCSGIEAATVAWHPLGWRPVAFAEVDRFPSAVLRHHYPDTPNWGDMTRFAEWPDAAVDVLVGGTPCQSFSVAGLRRGMADPRGNLALTYLAIADGYRPEWLVWENVPGVLSSNHGRDFGSFLGGLAELGYGFAYRVLDAQHFGVPQRRRRVFVVGHSGDWRRAAAVLFERASLSGHPAPRREAGQGVARPIARGSERGSGYRNDADTAENLIAHALNAKGGSGRSDGESETFVCAPPLTSNPYGDHESREGLLVAHSLRADGFDASEDGTGRGTPLVPVAFSAKDHGGDAGETAPTLRAGGHTTSHANAGVMPAIAFAQNSRDEVRLFGGDGATAGALAAEPGIKQQTFIATSAVRRLTPRECERLQGFPDDYTAIPYRGKPAADGPRYKALGNSMAVPVMTWIGRRIDMVSAIEAGKAAA